MSAKPEYISLYQFLKHFPDEEAAVSFLRNTAMDLMEFAAHDATAQSESRRLYLRSHSLIIAANVGSISASVSALSWSQAGYLCISGYWLHT